MDRDIRPENGQEDVHETLSLRRLANQLAAEQHIREATYPTHEHLCTIGK